MPGDGLIEWPGDATPEGPVTQAIINASGSFPAGGDATRSNNPELLCSGDGGATWDVAASTADLIAGIVGLGQSVVAIPGPYQSRTYWRYRHQIVTTQGGYEGGVDYHWAQLLTGGGFDKFQGRLATEGEVTYVDPNMPNPNGYGSDLSRYPGYGNQFGIHAGVAGGAHTLDVWWTVIVAP
jgi:hypothetical protein